MRNVNRSTYFLGARISARAKDMPSPVHAMAGTRRSARAAANPKVVGLL